MEQTDTAAPMAGSIADVAARLALWGRRAPKGLARVEFVSDFSRQKVVSQLRATLPQHIPVHEIELPFQKPALEIVYFLRERLHEMPLGVVSVTGFATAFADNLPLVDSLRVLNFHRDNIAQFFLCQVWWMSPRFTEAFLRSVPDFDSWFMLRVKLSELTERTTQLREFTKHLSEADEERVRRQAGYLAERAVRPLQQDAITLEEYLHIATQAVRTLKQVSHDSEATALAETLLSVIHDKGLLNDANTGGTIKARGNLDIMIAGLHDVQKNYAEAERLYKRALLYEAGAHDGSNKERTHILASLAWVLANQNKIEEATIAFNNAYEMALADFASEGNYTDYLVFLRTLIHFYRYTNQLEMAASYANIALTIAEEYSGFSSRTVAARANDLATVYIELGRYKEAELLLERALDMTKALSAPTDARSATLVANLGQLYIRQGRLQEAETLFNKALSIREQVFGVSHVGEVEILKQYCELLHNLDRGEEAMAIADRMNAIRAGQLNKNSADA